MATIKEAFSAKLQTTKTGDVEDRAFTAGEKVHIVQEWQHHYLVKTTDGHYFNLKKELVQQ